MFFIPYHTTCIMWYPQKNCVSVRLSVPPDSIRELENGSLILKKKLYIVVPYHKIQVKFNCQQIQKCNFAIFGSKETLSPDPPIRIRGCNCDVSHSSYEEFWMKMMSIAITYFRQIILSTIYKSGSKIVTVHWYE